MSRFPGTSQREYDEQARRRQAHTDTLSDASKAVLDLVRGEDDDYAACRKGYSVVSWHVRDFVLHVHAIRDEDGSSEIFEFDVVLRRADRKQL